MTLAYVVSSPSDLSNFLMQLFFLLLFSKLKNILFVPFTLFIPCSRERDY